MPNVFRFSALGSRIPNIAKQPTQTQEVDKHIISDGSGFETMNASQYKDLSKSAGLSGHVQEKISKLKVDDKKAIKDKKKKNKKITFVL